MPFKEKINLVGASTADFEPKSESVSGGLPKNSAVWKHLLPAQEKNGGPGSSLCPPITSRVQTSTPSTARPLGRSAGRKKLWRNRISALHTARFIPKTLSCPPV